MLLNETSQKVVSLFKDIGERVVMSYPITNFKDSAQTIVVFIDFSKFLNEPFETFGLMKIKEFLELMKIVGVNDNNELEDGEEVEDDFNIYLENNVIHINKKGIKCKYITTNLEVLQDITPNPKMLENIKNSDSCLDFWLLGRDIDKIKKVSQLLSLEDVVIRSDKVKGKMNIGVSNTNILSANNDSMTMEINHFKMDTTQDHNVILSVTNLKKIPCDNYYCRLLKHAKAHDNYIIHLIPKSIEGIDIILATRAVSNNI